MSSLRRPSPARIQAFLAAQREAPFSYPEVGATRGGASEGHSGTGLPAGYRVDRASFTVGHGVVDFERAKVALRSWALYDGPGRIRLVEPRPKLEEGAVVALQARHLGVWTLSACRVVYVVEDPKVFAFAYGTLEHAVCGEERFEVALDAKGDVELRLLAFSRPSQLLVRLAGPLTRRFQRQAGEAYAAALRQAIRTSARLRSQG